MQIQAQASWQLFFDHSELPVIVCSISTAAIHQVNAPCLDLLGYDEALLNGKSK